MVYFPETGGHPIVEAAIMRPTYRSFRRLGLSLAVVALACADATSSRSRTTVFVLRSLGGEQVPATILSGGTSYVVLADTLFIANALKEHHIGLDETDDGIWSIYFGTVLLAKVDEREMIIRD